MSPRPIGVTIVAIVVWLNGLLQVLGAATALFAFAGLDAGAALVTTAVLSLLLGVIALVLGVGLLRGSPTVRGLVTVLLLLSIANAVFAVFLSPAQAVTPVLTIVLAAVGIVMLWTGRASEFFSRRP